MDQHSTSDQSQTGLLAGISGVARNLFGLFVTRVELLTIELGEARDNVVRLMLIGAIGVLLLGLALVSWTALIVVLSWEAMGWKILLVVAAGYTLLSLVVLLIARARMAGTSQPFPSTMAELRSDRDALFRSDR